MAHVEDECSLVRAQAMRAFFAVVTGRRGEWDLQPLEYAASLTFVVLDPASADPTAKTGTDPSSSV
jgi:hypothetical protein